MTFDALDELSVTTLRTLAMDAVQRADSGHPGAPMALAPVAHVLFTRVLTHNPSNPSWPDRDRFVLSCGHASMLLYGALHLSGYDLGLDEIRSFRQWGSRTPGHPERGLTPGVEITTGPLGQGCGASVGMALAEAHLAARFNRPGHTVVDHRTWVLCSDGDLMEGVASEAASLAGHLRLGKLVWIWDDNRITIEGSTELTFSENVARRFEDYGWRVLRVADANDLPAVAAALAAACSASDRPTLIAVRSHIAWGAPAKQDTADAHGAPLGEEEVSAAKRAYGWPADEHFLVPDGVRERCRQVDRGRAAEAAWAARVAGWKERFPELAEEWRRRLAGELPEGWSAALPGFEMGGKGIATRIASGKVLNAIAGRMPELVGGSADLGPSCKTVIEASGDLTAAAPGERNLHFGIREHGMAAILNGLSLHGGIRPYGSTFLVFADYMRPSIRLAALMGLSVIYVFTHDSIWVGEDGPTHQPVEQLASLRTIPNLVVVRPADANETAAAWRVAVERRDGPTALVLSRQNLPVLAGTAELAGDGVAAGAYVLADGGSAPAVVLIATGSEVALAAAARETLAARGIAARVVSMPSWELFAGQPAASREAVLPQGVPRLAIEAGVTMGWCRWVGERGEVVGLDRFGASAPGKIVAVKLGITAEAVVERALALVGRG
ncbi:MAG: transketolase [Holophagae bacterium]|nr:MAG: transketolase [Holophagae bacterium]